MSETEDNVANRAAIPGHVRRSVSSAQLGCHQKPFRSNSVAACLSSWRHPSSGPSSHNLRTTATETSGVALGSPTHTPKWRPTAVSKLVLHNASSMASPSSHVPWQVGTKKVRVLARPNSSDATHASLHAQQACHHRQQALHSNKQANARAGNAGQDRTGLPSTIHSPPEDGWFLSGFRCGQQAQEIGRFPRPTAANFAREHDQSGPGASTHQLWISLFFQAPCTDQRHSASRSAVSTDKGHQGGVKGEREEGLLPQPRVFDRPVLVVAHPDPSLGP